MTLYLTLYGSWLPNLSQIPPNFPNLPVSLSKYSFHSFLEIQGSRLKAPSLGLILLGSNFCYLLTGAGMWHVVST